MSNFGIENSRLTLCVVVLLYVYIYMFHLLLCRLNNYNLNFLNQIFERNLEIYE